MKIQEEALKKHREWKGKCVLFKEFADCSFIRADYNASYKKALLTPEKSLLETLLSCQNNFYGLSLV